MNSISEFDNGLDDLDDCWDDRSINSDDSIDYSARAVEKTKKVTNKKPKIEKVISKPEIIKAAIKPTAIKPTISKSTLTKPKEKKTSVLITEEKPVVKLVNKTSKVAKQKVLQADWLIAEEKPVVKLVNKTSKVATQKVLQVASESGKIENIGETSFPLDQFDLTESTVQLLKDRGIESLFPIQAETFWPIRQGKDLIGRARTGQGAYAVFRTFII
jgi:ATP-dependent RNA helicase DDX21